MYDEIIGTRNAKDASQRNFLRQQRPIPATKPATGMKNIKSPMKGSNIQLPVMDIKIQMATLGVPIYSPVAHGWPAGS